MSVTKPQFAEFLANNLRELPRNCKVPNIPFLTLDSWQDSTSSTPTLPTAYSLHRLSVNTGQRFFISSHDIWVERMQPTYWTVPEEVVISQRVEACIQAYERWPGNSPPKYIEWHIPQMSTIFRLLNRFTETTFRCGEEGIAFDGWDHYPVLRRYRGSAHQPAGPTAWAGQAATANIPANPSSMAAFYSTGVTIAIAGAWPLGDGVVININ